MDANNANGFLLKDSTLQEAVIVITDDSPLRLEALKLVGLHPKVMPSTFQAEKLFDIGLSAKLAVKAAAEESAREVAEKLKKSNKKYDIVMGFHTVAVMNDKVFAKPSTREEALTTLKLLSGGTHSIVTGVMLLHASQKFETFVVETQVKFADIPDAMLQQYVDSDLWAQTFTGYEIFQNVFIESINGCIYNVMGVPVGAVVKGIRKLMHAAEEATVPPQVPAEEFPTCIHMISNEREHLSSEALEAAAELDEGGSLPQQADDVPAATEHDEESAADYQPSSTQTVRSTWPDPAFCGSNTTIYARFRLIVPRYARQVGPLEQQDDAAVIHPLGPLESHIYRPGVGKFRERPSRRF